MEAPMGRYYKKIIKREGTDSGIAKARSEAQRKGKPYFTYPIDEEHFVLFGTPGVTPTPEQKKIVEEYFLNEKSDSFLSKIKQRTINIMSALLHQH